MRQTTPTTTDPTAQLLADRLLLSPGMDDYLQKLLIVAVDGTAGSYETYVRLSIVAPGMKPDELDGIRHDLVDRLRAALRPTAMGDEVPDLDDPTLNDNRWIYRVTVESDLGMPQVVLTITEPQYLGSQSAPAVLSLVRGLMTPVAEDTFRRLVVLGSAQRLVPLIFKMEEVAPHSIEVTLPAALNLRETHRPGDAYDQEDRWRRCKALRHTLEVILGIDREFGQVDVRPIDGATHIYAMYTSSLSAGAVNRVQRLICQVAALHTTSEGFHNQLVFVPAYPANVFVDDGTERYELLDWWEEC